MTATGRTPVAGRRIRLAALAVATVAVGLAVHLLLAGPIADFNGDALYAVLVFLLVALVNPRLRPITTGLIAFAICTAVELFQLTGLPAEIASQFSPASLVLGGAFSFADLLAYAVGATVATVVRQFSPRRSSSGPISAGRPRKSA